MTHVEQSASSATTPERRLDFRPGMGMWWEIVADGTATERDSLEAKNWLEPDLATPPVHVHPSAEESYEVVEGALEVFLDGTWRRLGPGERATVPAGAPHTLRNASDGVTCILNSHRPAQRFEAFFRDMHRLIHEGKIKRLPPKDPRSAIYVGMLFAKYSDEIRTTKPPNQLLQALALVGRVSRLKV
jgi:mannose-6-phosphate isomerase-like protein (cupin superfamily)